MNTKLKTIFASAAATLIGAGWLTIAAANTNNVRGQLDTATVLMMSVMALATACAAGVTASEINSLRRESSTPQPRG
jgi:uncharacterized membrane protein YozB (DUF420 family)